MGLVVEEFDVGLQRAPPSLAEGAGRPRVYVAGAGTLGPQGRLGRTPASGKK